MRAIAMLALALAGCAGGAAKNEGYEFRHEGCARLVEGETTEADARQIIGGTPVAETRSEDGLLTVRWSYEKEAESSLGTVGGVARPLLCVGGVAAAIAGVPGASAACGLGHVGAGPNAGTESGRSFECQVVFREGVVYRFSHSLGRAHAEGAGF